MPKGLRKLTQADMDQFIDHEEYHVFFGTHTVCVLRAKNGQTCLGQSVAHRVEDYNERVGKEEARRDAIRNMWPMLTCVAKSGLLDDSPIGENLGGVN